jgi:hypothetical protein
MRPVYVTVNGPGVSPPIPMDYRKAVTYTVQHTYDDITSPTFNPATAAWFNNSVINVATGNAETVYSFPVRALRLNIVSGAGSVTMGVIQGTGTS